MDPIADSSSQAIYFIQQPWIEVIHFVFIEKGNIRDKVFHEMTTRHHVVYPKSLIFVSLLLFLMCHNSIFVNKTKWPVSYTLYFYI